MFDKNHISFYQEENKTIWEAWHITYNEQNNCDQYELKYEKYYSQLSFCPE